MTIFTLSLLLAPLPFLLPVAIVWLVQHGKRERALIRANAEVAPLNAQIRKLEQRLATAEALVIEPGYRLTHQIEALRDAA